MGQGYLRLLNKKFMNLCVFSEEGKYLNRAGLIQSG